MVPGARFTKVATSCSDRPQTTFVDLFDCGLVCPAPASAGRAEASSVPVRQLLPRVLPGGRSAVAPRSLRKQTPRENPLKNRASAGCPHGIQSSIVTTDRLTMIFFYAPASDRWAGSTQPFAYRHSVTNRLTVLVGASWAFMCSRR